MIINYNSAVMTSLTGSRCYISFREYNCIHSPDSIQITYYDAIPIGTRLTIRIYMRATGPALSSTVLTGYIYGISTSTTSFTKVIDFPNIGTVTIGSDNQIDLPLF